MADEDVYGLTEDEHRDFLRMLQEFRARPQPATTADNPEQRGDIPPPIVAVLLDPLECGATAMAAVLAKRSTNNIQIITAYGQPGAGFFRLGFRASPGATTQWTQNYYPAAEDASKLQEYLSALPGVGIGNVEVTLGLVTLTDESVHNMWRWEIVFCGRFAGQTLPMLSVEQTLTGSALLVQANNPLEPTGAVELINEVVGVPIPSPLRAGCRILAQWHLGIGYVPYVCEIRDFNDFGIFSQ